MDRKLYFASIAFILIQVTGGYQHRHNSEFGCSKCPPGYRVAKACFQTNDTVCVPCEENTYQSHNSYKQKCYMCSECGRDLYVAHECTPIRDTICDSCHTYKGPKNEDYQLRCAKYIRMGETGLLPESKSDRRTIPSNRQMERLQQLKDPSEEEPSNTYLAMMLVGIGACALACLLTGIVVYSCYGAVPWKDWPSHLYKGVYREEQPTNSQMK